MLDEWPLCAVVHFVVESARVAQIVSSAVATPQRRRNRAAIDAFTTVHLLVVLVVGHGAIRVEHHRCWTASVLMRKMVTVVVTRPAAISIAGPSAARTASEIFKKKNKND